MTLRSLAGALVLVLGSPASLPRAPADDGAPAAVSFEVFEEGLAPYGEWTTAGTYGRVWSPTGVAPEWRPYVDGEWVWTVEGWFWSSDEPWAWATYHYGRWVLDPWLGWIWVPGYAWAPAWVAWRAGGGFIGWAPLPPGVVTWWVDPAPIAAPYWVFVPAPRFVGHHLRRAMLPPARVPELVRGTRPAPPRAPGGGTEAPLRGGPPPRLVEAELGRPLPAPAPIVAVPSPAAARGRTGESVPAFRPGLSAPPPKARAHAPAAPAPAAAGRRPPRAGSGEVRPAPKPERGEAPSSSAEPAPRPAPARP